MKAVNLAVEPFSYITYTELECVTVRSVCGV